MLKLKGGCTMFYVIEIQTSNNSGAIIPFTFTNRADAEAKYHSLLAVCAKSEVIKHGAMLFNDDGFIIKSEMYDRTVTE